MELKDALDKIQFDKKLTDEFLKDPKGVLESLGVDTSDVFIDPSKEPISGAKALDICVKVCANVGAPLVGCHEVGKKVGM